MKTFEMQKVVLCKEGACEYTVRGIGDAQDLCESIGLANECEEHLVMFCMNVNGDVTASFEIAHGSINECATHPRDVFKRALLANAAGIIIAHNHPSGSASPSEADLETCKRLSDAGSLMGIPLLDFVIAAPGGGFYSANAAGEM